MPIPIRRLSNPSLARMTPVTPTIAMAVPMRYIGFFMYKRSSGKKSNEITIAHSTVDLSTSEAVVGRTMLMPLVKKV